MRNPTLVKSETSTYQASRYNHFVPINDKGDHVLYNAYSGSLTVINSEVVPKISSVLSDSLNEDDSSPIKQALIHGKFLIPSSLNELEKISKELMTTRVNKKKGLMLVLMPTLQCNFNCVYCYETEEIRSRVDKMSEEVQEQVIQLVKERVKDSTSINIEWYGGEPLLGYDVIESLSKKMIQICEENNTPFYARMISNSFLLTKEKLDTLVDLKVEEIMITLDGPKEIHNMRRRLKGGQGSFDKIMKSIDIASEKMRVIVRIHIDKDTANTHELLDYFKNHPNKHNLNISLTDLHLDKETIENRPSLTSSCSTSCSSSDSCSTIKEKVFMENTESSKIKLNFYDTLKENKMNTYSYFGVGPKKGVCVAEDKNGFVIGPKGELYACSRDIGIEDLITGYLDDHVRQNEDYEESYFKFDPTKQDPCMSCNIMPMCRGGCGKRNNEVGEMECPPIKFHINDILIKQAHAKLKKVTNVK
ncbi:radical SAM protein [bacterium]|jgi:uncharacterized protein|nr:radical SAM protein [bacterium]